MSLPLDTFRCNNYIMKNSSTKNHRHFNLKFDDDFCLYTSYIGLFNSLLFPTIIFIPYNLEYSLLWLIYYNSLHIFKIILHTYQIRHYLTNNSYTYKSVACTPNLLFMICYPHNNSLHNISLLEKGYIS